MAQNDAGRTKAMAAVQAIFDRYHVLEAKRTGNHRDYDYDVMKRVKLLDAGPEGSVLFELEITENYSNLNDVMHGGAAGVIMDMCTTTALGPLSKPGYWYFLGGVTRSLNISYLRGVPIGTIVRIRSRVLQCGRTMALIRGDMVSQDEKTVYLTAEHHKVNVPMKDAHMAARIPFDEQYDEEVEKKVAEQVKASNL